MTRLLLRLAAPLLLVVAAVQPARADVLDRLLASLRLCQLPHLTTSGWFGTAPSRFYVREWTPGLVRELAAAARLRPERTRRRDSRGLQAAVGSSYQASATYEALAEAMEAAEVSALDRPELSARAEAAYARRLAKGGFEACVTVKWGNRWPDFILQPMPSELWRALIALFEPGRLDWPPDAAEREALEAGLLTPEELAELRGLRVANALFEHQYEMLRNDRGGWTGNAQNEPFVCTDEATTHSYFMERLEEAGALRRFRQHGGRFARRDPVPLLPADHFAPMLENLRTGEFWVVDSWAEDGGAPPRVDVLRRWLEAESRPGFVSLGDAELDRLLAAEAVEHGRPEAMRLLEARLRELAPEWPAPVPSGRPTHCENGFHFCGPPERMDAWGPAERTRPPQS